LLHASAHATPGKKLVAEYVDDAPVCGTMLALESNELEPPSTYGVAETLALAAAKHQLQQAPTAAAATPARPAGSNPGALPAPESAPPVIGGAGSVWPPPGPRLLPLLHLAQPAKVLAREFVAVRRARGSAASPPGAGEPASSLPTTCSSAGVSRSSGIAGSFAVASAKPKAYRVPCAGGSSGAAGAAAAAATLGAERLELLRHAFTLIAGSEQRGARLPLAQLTELAVLAGLDPAAPTTAALLLGRVRGRAAAACGAAVAHAAGAPGRGRGAQGEGGGGGSGAGVSLDALLHEAMHFREAEAVLALVQPGAGEGRGSGALGSCCVSTVLHVGEEEGSDASCGPEGAQQADEWQEEEGSAEAAARSGCSVAAPATA
jgi:hypothetical protein